MNQHIAANRIYPLSGAIVEAVEAAQVGFHFEEGGCWGFAAALYDFFSDNGISSRIAVQKTGFVHAWVTALEQSWDHQGIMSNKSRNAVQVARHELELIACINGVPEEQFLADTSEAKEILANVPRRLSMA